MVMYWGNACFVRGRSTPTGVGDPKSDEGQLSVLQLAMDSEEEASTRLTGMVEGGEELPNDPDNQLGLISTKRPETLAGYMPSLQLGISCSDLVEISKAAAQLLGTHQEDLPSCGTRGRISLELNNP